MNERRNPTLYADNRFFSSSFHGFSRGDDSVAQRLWGRLALNRHISQNPESEILIVIGVSGN